VIYGIWTLIGALIFTAKSNFYFGAFEIIIIILLLFLATYFYKKHSKIFLAIIFLVFGYLWSYIFSFNIFNTSVPQQHHNKYTLTTGIISSLIDKNKQRDRFIFKTIKPFKSKLRLSIYGKNRPNLKVGQKWQFSVKIKTNNSYQNEASFDYEKWLFTNKINATGYINSQKPYKFIEQTSENILNQIREKIKIKLKNITSNLEFSGLFNALLIGDKSSIKLQNKQILTKTGTSHLSVISGLHLGIIASITFLIFNAILSRLKFITNNIPVVVITAFITIFTTFFYMALAGFSTPTVRAFIMIAVFMLTIISKRNIFKWQIYFLALFVVLVFNPISVLEVGFWLSFIASGIIVYFINFNSNASSVNHKIWQTIYLQLFISILMSPIVLWFFGELSIFSPIANIIAIPIFSIIIVPFSFIALMLAGFENLSFYIFNLLDIILHYLFDFLEFISNDKVRISYFLDNTWLFSAFILGVIFLLLHNKLHLKFLSIIIFVVIFTFKKPVNNHLHILDVGQGSSAVFAIKNNAIVFDTGNKFSSGFSLGSAVVVPFLKAKNITNIEKIIISHKDQDHKGGLDDILDFYKVNEIITSENNKCLEENSWQSIGLSSGLSIGLNVSWSFDIFTTDNKFKGNNKSCVVKINNGKKSILLSGDIEKEAEKYLLKKYGDKLKSDILIAPHHGSKTSSTIEFLKVVNPKIAIFSAGFQNSFKHPAKAIIKRYKDLGIKIFSTSCSGRISVNLNDLSIIEYRKDNKKFYHRKCKSI
jgi:competence protein ComEC